MERPFKDVSHDDLNEIADRIMRAGSPRADGDPLLDKIIGEIKSRDVLKEAQTIIDKIAAETGRAPQDIAEEILIRSRPKLN